MHFDSRSIPCDLYENGKGRPPRYDIARNAPGQNNTFTNKIDELRLKSNIKMVSTG